jgi:gas vesicle protein
MKAVNILVFVVMGLISLEAFADEKLEKGAGECHRELKAQCKDKTSGPEKFKCMKENISKLSPACQERMKEGREKFKGAMGACKDDKQKLCKDVKPGEGRIKNCLKENMDKVSPSCKEHIEKAKANQNSSEE